MMRLLSFILFVSCLTNGFVGFLLSGELFLQLKFIDIYMVADHLLN